MKLNPLLIALLLPVCIGCSDDNRNTDHNGYPLDDEGYPIWPQADEPLECVDSIRVIYSTNYLEYWETVAEPPGTARVTYHFDRADEQPPMIADCTLPSEEWTRIETLALEAGQMEWPTVSEPERYSDEGLLTSIAIACDERVANVSLWLEYAPSVLREIIHALPSWDLTDGPLDSRCEARARTAISKGRLAP